MKSSTATGSYTLLLTLPLLQGSLFTGRRGCNKDVSIRMEHSVISYFLYSKHLLFFFFLLIAIICQKKLLWCGLKGIIICTYDENALEVSSMHPLSRVIVLGFPLGPMTCLITDSWSQKVPDVYFNFQIKI